MASRRLGVVGQSLHHAPPRFLRSRGAPDLAPHPDKGREPPLRVTTAQQSKGKRAGLVRASAPRMVLGLLCCMYLILFINRVSISTAAPLMRVDLGINNAQLGLAFSAFSIPYALFQLIGGWVGDRLGPRFTLAACCAIVTAATVLTGAAGGFASLFAVRLALGFGEGAAFPTATRAMSSWTPVGSWGFAQGLTHSFSRIGNAVTPALMAAFLAFVSWRASFVILGSTTLIWR